MGLCFYNIVFFYTYDKKYPEKCNLQIIAEVIDIKEEKSYTVKYLIKVLKKSSNYIELISNHNVVNKSNAHIGNTKLILYIDKNYSFSPGDIIYVEGSFEKASTDRNYKGFNYRRYLKQDKIYGILYGENLNLIARKNDCYFIIGTIKEKIVNQIDILYEEIYADILKAILVGIDSIDDGTKESFRDSSLSHILAISGMHISYIVLCLDFFLQRIINSKKIKNDIIISFLIIFNFITGFSLSCVRASIMNIAILISSNANRKNTFIVTFFISFLIILVINPFNIFNVGMWLSYCGTLGIVIFYNFLSKLFKKKILKSTSVLRVDYKIKSKILDLILLSFSAQILIIPIIIYNFNTVSLSFFIPNILISFFIAPILILGYISIIVNLIFPKLGKFISIFEKKLVYIIFNIAKICSKLPFSKIFLPTPSIIVIVIFYIFLFSTIFFIQNRKFYYFRFFLSIKFTQNKIKNLIIKMKGIVYKRLFIYIMLFVIIANFVIQLKKNSNLIIHFIDVGQGDSMLIITPLGKKVIIDGGEGNNEKYDYGKNVVLPYLLDKRIIKIDYLIVSHFDSDHCGGLFALIENLKVKNIVIGKQAQEYKNCTEFLKIANKKKINLIVVEIGNKIQIEPDICLKALWPNSSKMIFNNGINNNSIVAKLEYKEFSMLLTGDIEEEAEKEILNKYADNLELLNSSVLKIAHHGSKTSTTSEFLQVVKPQIALIGVGRNNTFGHPNEIIIKRLKERNIKIYRTDEDGEITIKTDGKKLKINEFIKGKSESIFFKHKLEKNKHTTIR